MSAPAWSTDRQSLQVEPLRHTATMDDRGDAASPSNGATASNVMQRIVAHGHGPLVVPLDEDGADQAQDRALDGEVPTALVRRRLAGKKPDDRLPKEACRRDLRTLDDDGTSVRPRAPAIRVGFPGPVTLGACRQRPPSTKHTQGRLGRLVEDPEQRPSRTRRPPLALFPVADGLVRHVDAPRELHLVSPRRRRTRRAKRPMSRIASASSSRAWRAMSSSPVASSTSGSTRLRAWGCGTSIWACS